MKFIEKKSQAIVSFSEDADLEELMSIENKEKNHADFRSNL